MTQYNDTRSLTSNEQMPMVTVNNNSDNQPATLWLIDDDAALRLVLADTFEDAGLTVISFTQAQAAWTRLNDILQALESAASLPDVILTDIRMPMMDGLSFSDWVHQYFPKLPIVIMTAHSDLTSAISSYQTGAFEYLPKPFDLDEAVTTIYKAINYQPNQVVSNHSIKSHTNMSTDIASVAAVKPEVKEQPTNKLNAARSARKAPKVAENKATFLSPLTDLTTFWT